MSDSQIEPGRRAWKAVMGKELCGKPEGNPNPATLCPHLNAQAFLQLRCQRISAKQMKLPAERDEEIVVDEHQRQCNRSDAIDDHDAGLLRRPSSLGAVDHILPADNISV